MALGLWDHRQRLETWASFPHGPTLMIHPLSIQYHNNPAPLVSCSLKVMSHRTDASHWAGCVRLGVWLVVYKEFWSSPTHMHMHRTADINLHSSLILTIELGRETKSVIALVLFMPVAIVTNTSGGVLAAALVSGMRDRVLDWAVLQPSSITPV